MLSWIVAQANLDSCAFRRRGIRGELSKMQRYLSLAADGVVSQIGGDSSNHHPGRAEFSVA